MSTKSINDCGDDGTKILDYCKRYGDIIIRQNGSSHAVVQSPYGSATVLNKKHLKRGTLHAMIKQLASIGIICLPIVYVIYNRLFA